MRRHYPSTADDTDWDGYARDQWQRADTLDPGARAITRLDMDAIELWLARPLEKRAA